MSADLRVGRVGMKRGKKVATLMDGVENYFVILAIDKSSRIYTIRSLQSYSTGQP